MSGRDAVLSALNVSRETSGRLELYAGLLERWTPKINLVARGTVADLWSRHIADSAQALDLAPPSARTWADLGSGGGFPGLVVAILSSERRPDLRVTLVEADQRKATFLRTVLRETGVIADVIAKRIEEIPPLGADVVSARALAPLPRLLDYAAMHLSPSGTALFLKGAGYRTEVQEALETWAFRCEEIPSKTSADGVILRIGEIERV